MMKKTVRTKIQKIIITSIQSHRQKLKQHVSNHFFTDSRKPVTTSQISTICTWTFLSNHQSPFTVYVARFLMVK